MTANIVDLSAYRQAKAAVNHAQAPFTGTSEGDGADRAGGDRYIQVATRFLLDLPPTATASAPCLLFADASGQLSVHGPMEEGNEFPADLMIVAALAPLGCALKLASREEVKWLSQANRQICRLAVRIHDVETRCIAS